MEAKTHVERRRGSKEASKEPDPQKDKDDDKEKKSSKKNADFTEQHVKNWQGNLALGFAVVLIVVCFYLTHNYEEPRNPKYLGDKLQNVPSSDELNELEKNRWNASVPFSFPDAKPVQIVKVSPMHFDIADQLMDYGKPVVLKGLPVADWTAIEKWKDPNYVKKHLPTMFCHAPSKSQVRMHQPDETHPFANLDVNWTRPWREAEIYTDIFFEAKKLVYFMNSAAALGDMQNDFWVDSVSVVYTPPMEVNVWMGTPTVTTPAHYDMVHNFYSQVVGQKRFIMFPPDDDPSLYTFTNLHPSARMSQINFNDPSNYDYQKFPKFKNVHPIEVILSPGDVLYIPPFWFHYVSVVGESVSISVSTHTESSFANIRDRVIGKSEAFFRQFWGRNTQIKWDTNTKFRVLYAYVTELFPTKEEAKSNLTEILESHWSHLEYDTEAPGLPELIEKGRKKFPDVDTLSKVKIPSKLLARIKLASKEIFGLYEECPRGVLKIMLAAHIEQISSHVLGALSVDPALRVMEQLLANELAQPQDTSQASQEQPEESLKGVLEELETVQ